MSSALESYNEIESAILHLPMLERSRLASRLLESLEDDRTEISPKWQEELDRRSAEIDRGETKTISSEELWSEVSARFETSL